MNKIRSYRAHVYYLVAPRDREQLTDDKLMGIFLIALGEALISSTPFTTVRNDSTQIDRRSSRYGLRYFAIDSRQATVNALPALLQGQRLQRTALYSGFNTIH